LAASPILLLVSNKFFFTWFCSSLGRVLCYKILLIIKIKIINIFKMFNKVIIYSVEIALCMMTVCSHLLISSVEALKAMGCIEIHERACCGNIRKIVKTFV